LTKSVDQTAIPDDTWTAVTFDQEEYDITDFHDNVTNNTRISFNSNNAGRYIIREKIKHSTMFRTASEMRVIKNGSTVLEGTCDVNVGTLDTSYETLTNTSYEYDFVAGDYIELQYYQSGVSPGTEDVLSANTFFSVERKY
jgi:hypothetical protein